MCLRLFISLLLVSTFAEAQQGLNPTTTTEASGSPVVKMEAVSVEAKNQTFLNSIDRKIYNVGKDIQATTGSASDLLQNIPSVQVDIDGNLSLRGLSLIHI